MARRYTTVGLGHSAHGKAEHINEVLPPYVNKLAEMLRAGRVIQPPGHPTEMLFQRFDDMHPTALLTHTSTTYSFGAVLTDRLFMGLNPQSQYPG